VPWVKSSGQIETVENPPTGKRHQMFVWLVGASAALIADGENSFYPRYFEGDATKAEPGSGGRGSSAL